MDRSYRTLDTDSDIVRYVAHDLDSDASFAHDADDVDRVWNGQEDW